MRKAIATIALLLALAPSTARAECLHLEMNELAGMTKPELEMTFNWYWSETLELLCKSIKNQKYIKDAEACRDEMVRLYRIYNKTYPGEADRLLR